MICGSKPCPIIQTKISKPSFDTWFKSTKIIHSETPTLTILAPNEFARDWLEGKYAQLIKNTLDRDHREPKEIQVRH